MAIYHLSAQIIGRSSGRSSVAAAAYRAGEDLRDERTGLSHDYSRRRDIDAWIQAPSSAPSWVYARADLWNRVEATERRKDAQVCREINVALPVGLDRDRQDELVRRYVAEQFTRRGMVADVAVHRQDPGNPHAHMLLTMRPIDGDRFGPKEREWNSTQTLQGWRESWGVHANRELERSGQEERIDHRSHRDRGIDREPTVHEGPNVREMEARGIRTERGDWNRAVMARNEARDREEARRRDPVERRAAAWEGIGYSRDTSRVLAIWERERGKEFGTDGEARDALGRERDAIHRQGWALKQERVTYGELCDHARWAREALDTIESSSAWRRAFSADARLEYERAKRDLGDHERELGRAGVGGPEDLERRGEDLGAREGVQRAREGSWGRYEKAWREIGDVMEQRREAERQQECEERWERTDRMRGDPPGTAKAREEMDRGDEWGR
jgi:hypothetical protein